MLVHHIPGVELNINSKQIINQLDGCVVLHSKRCTLSTYTLVNLLGFHLHPHPQQAKPDARIELLKINVMHQQYLTLPKHFVHMLFYA